MATEFTVKLENRPGALAELGHAMGKAGINIDAFHGLAIDTQGVVQFVPDDVDGATRTLEGAGISFTTREVIVVNILDEPGTLGDVAMVMASAGINIEAAYVTMQGFVVLAVDDLAGAKEVAGGMAVMK